MATRISLEWPLAAVRICARVRIGRRRRVPEGARLASFYTSGTRAQCRSSAGHMTRDGHLSAIGLVPFKNSLAFAVQDAQRDRFRCEGEICCSNNCSGHVQRLNFDLAQDQQSTTWRSAKNRIQNGCGVAARMRFSSSGGAGSE